MITGFEPFHIIDAEEMAEDLRKVCAGATSGKRLKFLPIIINNLKILFFCVSFANDRETWP
jgi:hypothetical protein